MEENPMGEHARLHKKVTDLVEEIVNEDDREGR